MRSLESPSMFRTRIDGLFNVHVKEIPGVTYLAKELFRDRPKHILHQPDAHNLVCPSSLVGSVCESIVSR